MRLIFFFLKCSKFYVDSKNAKNFSTKCVIFKINAFELVAVISPYYDENT